MVWDWDGFGWDWDVGSLDGRMDVLGAGGRGVRLGLRWNRVGLGWSWDFDEDWFGLGMVWRDQKWIRCRSVVFVSVLVFKVSM